MIYPILHALYYIIGIGALTYPLWSKKIRARKIEVRYIYGKK